MRCVVYVLAVLAVATALPAHLPDPGELAYVLSADDWDAYQDAWLAKEYLKRNGKATSARNSGCALRVNGDLGQPQSVYMRNNQYVEMTGTTGLANLNVGEELLLGCTGSGRTIMHPKVFAILKEAVSWCLMNGGHFCGHASTRVGWKCCTCDMSRSLKMDSIRRESLGQAGENSRMRIAEAGYNTIVYTGTFGVGVVRDADGRHHELYLSTDANNNKQLPVPRYFYKVLVRAYHYAAVQLLSG